MQLYPDQQAFKADLYATIRSGAKRIACVLPTGAGKTIVMLRVIEDALKKTLARKAQDPLSPSIRILFCSDRDVLVKQPLQRMKEYDALRRSYYREHGLPELFFSTGVIKAKYPEHQHLPIQIASLQSLNKSRSWALNTAWDIIFLDEAHETLNRKATKQLLDANPDAIFLGFTATPYLLSPRRCFGDTFTHIVQGKTPSQLIEDGRLVPIEYYSFPDLDLSAIRQRNGDYATDELKIAVNKQELIDHAYREWMRLTPGKSTLAFCVSVEHATAVSNYFSSRGVKSAVVTGDTPSKERDTLYKQIANGDITLLAAVNVLSTGFDVPTVEVGLCCRPTMSLSLFHQMIGRIMRVADGKTSGYWLDLAGNCNNPKLSLPEEVTGYTLGKASEARGEGVAPHKFCTTDKLKEGSVGCGAMNHASTPICKSCGAPFQPREHTVVTHDLVRLNVERSTDNPQRDFYRQQLRKCYKSRPQKNPRAAFHAYRKEYTNIPQPSWAAGAVFGDNPGEAEYIALAQYLRNVAGDQLGTTWVHSRFIEEFPSREARKWLVTNVV